MDIEEKKEKIRHMYKYFVKSFWFSVILLVIAWGIALLFRGQEVGFVARYFQMPPSEWNHIMFLIFGFWEILIIQFTLIPTIVLWDFKRCLERGGCKREVI